MSINTSSPGKQPLSAYPSSSLKGEILLPGDKSISHRALIFGGLAQGQTTIYGLLEGDDILHTAEAMRALGAIVEKKKDYWVVQGTGNGCLLEPTQPLYFGNSGTGARLIMGLIASYPMEVTFTGDASLSKRPMRRITDPLQQMGTQICNDSKKDGLPLTLKGPLIAHPISYATPVASAQVKSAVLLAGLNCPGITEITEKTKTRDHTEKMLEKFGAKIEIKEGPEDSYSIRLLGQQKLSGQTIHIAGDPSSAAFLIVAALITKNSDIIIKNMLMNPTRIGFLESLLEMGANIEILKRYKAGGEDVADMRIRSSHLKAITIPAKRAASMIDEYPILAIASAYAIGQTKMEGLSELRVKESDRLYAIAKGLKENGVSCIEGEDYLIVNGQEAPHKGGATVETYHDHRIAMSFLIFGLTTKDPITVDDTNMIATSFPQFIKFMKNLGAHFS